MCHPKIGTMEISIPKYHLFGNKSFSQTGDPPKKKEKINFPQLLQALAARHDTPAQGGHKTSGDRSKYSHVFFSKIQKKCSPHLTETCLASWWFQPI